MSRPAFSPGLALVVAVVAVSWGSIFARLCHAPPLVIAFHRLGFSTLLLLPILAARGEATRLFQTSVEGATSFNAVAAENATTVPIGALHNRPSRHLAGPTRHGQNEN